MVDVVWIVESSDNIKTGCQVKRSIKRYGIVTLIVFVVGALLFVLHHLAFPYEQVNRVNYLFIWNGMSKSNVELFLGPRGYVLKNRVFVPDPGSPNGERAVEGDEVLGFSNTPPTTPNHIIYVGFANDRVVDKCYVIEE
jgi:hypothetical protein